MGHGPTIPRQRNLATRPTPLNNQTAEHHRIERTRLVLTYVTADINCPTCFNQVIETITATPGVHTVDPRNADGCIAITHDLDERVLIAAITTIGHTVDVASNGEITMGRAHAVAVQVCTVHEPQS